MGSLVHAWLAALRAPADVAARSWGAGCMSRQWDICLACRAWLLRAGRARGSPRGGCPAVWGSGCSVGPGSSVLGTEILGAPVGLALAPVWGSLALGPCCCPHKQADWRRAGEEARAGLWWTRIPPRGCCHPPGLSAQGCGAPTGDDARGLQGEAVQSCPVQGFPGLLPFCLLVPRPALSHHQEPETRPQGPGRRGACLMHGAGQWFRPSCNT